MQRAETGAIYKPCVPRKFIHFIALRHPPFKYIPTMHIIVCVCVSAFIAFRLNIYIYANFSFSCELNFSLSLLLSYIKERLKCFCNKKFYLRGVDKVCSSEPFRPRPDLPGVLVSARISWNKALTRRYLSLTATTYLLLAFIISSAQSETIAQTQTMERDIIYYTHAKFIK